LEAYKGKGKGRVQGSSKPRVGGLLNEWGVFLINRSVVQCWVLGRDLQAPILHSDPEYLFTDSIPNIFLEVVVWQSLCHSRHRLAAGSGARSRDTHPTAPHDGPEAQSGAGGRDHGAAGCVPVMEVVEGISRIDGFVLNPSGSSDVYICHFKNVILYMFVYFHFFVRERKISSNCVG